jgi:hypothetical protein
MGDVSAIVIAVLLAFGLPVFGDSVSGLGDINATGNSGTITQITYNSNDYDTSSALVLGITTIYDGSDNPVDPTYAYGDAVSPYADDFSFDKSVSTTDKGGTIYLETIFGTDDIYDTFFVFENGGTDDASWYGVRSDGSMTGGVWVDASNTSAATGYSSGIGGQSLKGYVFTTSEPVAGIRILPGDSLGNSNDGIGFDMYSVSAIGPVASTAPVSTITATGDGGDILTISHDGETYLVGDGDLFNGTTTRYDGETVYNGGSYLSEYADDFDIGDAASLDGITHMESIFAEPAKIFFIFENSGNDDITVQGIDASGDLTGTTVSLTGNTSDYGDTGYIGAGQPAKGFCFMVDKEVYGIRITGGGFDALSVSAVYQAPPAQPPEITSSAVVDGAVGQLYEYDVEASGSPAPTYTLTTAPAGMTINSNTGLIQWTPAVTQLGLNAVEVTATNSEDSDFQVFDVNVVGTEPCSGYMIHYWNLDETAGAPYIDLTGGADASCIAGACPDPNANGVHNGCQIFDGSGTSLSSTDVVNPTDEITVMAWVYPLDLSQTGPDECIMSKNNVFELSIEENGDKVSWVILDSGGSYDEYEPSTSIYEGEWTHVAATFDGTDQVVYINGSKAGDDPAGFESIAGINNPYVIGYANKWENRLFDGAIDEAAVFDKALSETEINDLYQQGLAGKGYCKERPDFTALELVSVDGMVDISGSYVAGFDLMLNGQDQLYYLDLGSATAMNNDMLPDNSGPVYYGFSLTEPNQALIDYFEAKHSGQPYEDELIAIANGQSPIFYIEIEDIGGVESFGLVDGFLLDSQIVGPVYSQLRINGDYPEQSYEYTGTVYDKDGISNTLIVTMGVCHDTDGDDICDSAECGIVNLDGLGSVDLKDFRIMAGNWQLTGTGLNGDFDNDESVDIDDMAQIAEHWLELCQ